MKLYEIVAALEKWAPSEYQESYDNSGLIVGEGGKDVRKALVSLDCTEAVIDEAVSEGADLIISHHPIVFKGLKRFNASNYVERTVMKAIKNDIAIYAIHTNLDNVNTGVNKHLAEILGLEKLQILSPKADLLEKLVVFCPVEHAESVRSAMFDAGAGAIGAYDECSFNLEGSGTFRAGDGSQPFVGNKGERHTENEVRIETLVPVHRVASVVDALLKAHPYEEVAFDRLPVKNYLSGVGSGMIGELPERQDWAAFFDRVKAELKVSVIKHTALPSTGVARVAVCGGSGFFLLGAARKSGADLFITSDVKYHEFFDAEGIVLADIGHWESEHRTAEIIVGYLNEKFPKFAVHFSRINTNPVKYY